MLNNNFEALRSLEGLRGAFDTPSDKIPPDLAGGSLGSVTGWPASRSSSLSSFDSDSEYNSSPSISPISNKQVHPDVIFAHHVPQSKSNHDFNAPNYGGSSLPKAISTLSQSGPRNIPTKVLSKDAESNELATPPLTPDSSPVPTLSTSATLQTQDKAAQDFLMKIFPGSARTALPYAKSVRIASSELPIAADDMGSFTFEGVVLELPNRPRTLYIDGKGAENVKLRERYAVTSLSALLSLINLGSIVALLDLADEHLECTALIIALERSSPALAGLLHSFMYAGASVVTRPPFESDQAYVLVGIEI